MVKKQKKNTAIPPCTVVHDLRALITTPNELQKAKKRRQKTILPPHKYHPIASHGGIYYFSFMLQSMEQIILVAL